MTPRPALPPARTARARTFINRFSLVVAGVIAAWWACGPLAAAEPINAATQAQIESLMEEKAARTPAERKMDSQLVYFAKLSRNQAIASAVPTLTTDVMANADNRVLLDLKATVSEGLLNFIVQSGGVVVNHFAAYDAVRALLPVAAFEALAARPDVRFIEPAAVAQTNTGPVTSEGDRTHRANTARATFPTNGGSGVKIGVLSDGVASLAASIANGNLNASATVLASQAGSGDEGTAMMEIIQDLVPNAQIYFATAVGGAANMANNILALRAAGCSVIVDDVSYTNESPFQDQVISQAVSTVSAAGVMYFSSAANSGSKDKGTSGTWEGDFADGGAATLGTKAGRVHDFGSGAIFNTVTSVSSNGGGIGRVDLFWADPLGASTNDYDVFVTDAAGNVLRSSTNIQSGTQDPYETVSTLNLNERIVIVKTTAAASRFLHLGTGRSRIAINTEGNVRGHNAAGAANAFCVAATNVGNSPSPGFFVGGLSNPVESFSSDGPRRVFFTATGTAITPGNFSATGGQVLNKPDFTAADGGVTGVTGFSPFFGTSAAAPHAAAIAALLKSYNPALTPAQIRTLLTTTALDIEATGYDRVSGSGIIMALAAMQAAPAPDPLSISSTGFDATGPAGGPFSPSSGTYTLTNNSAAALSWTAAKTQTWATFSSAGGTLAAGASTTVTLSLDSTAAAAASLGSFSDTVTFTNVTTGITLAFPVSFTVVPLLPRVLFDSFTGATPTFTTSVPHTFMGMPVTLGSAGGTANISVTGGTVYLFSTTTTNYTNIRLNLVVWGAASGATSGTTSAFSNSLGSFSFDFGPLNAVANSRYTYAFTLPSPVIMPSLAGGITLNWQGDTGTGLASTDNLVSAIRHTGAMAVGALSVGTAGTYGYYRNASGESDGNFLGSSFRTLATVTNQGLALQLFGGPVPPLAVTNAADGVGFSAATLNASVNPGGAATTATFHYGTSASYGNTAAITLGASNGTTAQSVAANLSDLTPGTTYHFRVTASNSYGATNGRNLTFTTTAGSAPVITSLPASQAVLSGATVTFTVAANGAPPPGYQWQRQASGASGFVNLSNGGVFSGATAATLTITGATPAMSGDQFRCVVSNGVSPNVTGAAVTLTVNAPAAISSAANAKFILGLPGSFTITATGSPAPTFSANALPSWAALNPATGVISGTAPNATGSPFAFTLTASNGIGSASSQSFVLTVQVGHAADVSPADGALNLTELTRMIELYNSRSGTVRTGRYIASGGTVDGFAPAPEATGTATAPFHTADLNQDGRISLTELTRVLEIFTARSGATRTGAYHPSSGTEDGFAPGP